MSKQTEALKLALEALEDYVEEYGPHEQDSGVAYAITAIREALAEQPAQQEQEPFCYHDGRNIVGKEFADHSDVFPLYTSPPAQRKPLTLGQKQRLWSSVGDKPTLKDRVNAYGLAIEAAHGIKEKNT